MNTHHKADLRFPTVEEAYAAFMKQDRSLATQQSYHSFLGNRFIPTIGPRRRLDKVTPEDIADFVNDMRSRKVKYQNHPQHPEVEESLSPATVSRNFGMIRAFFNFCVRRYGLPRSPASEVFVRNYRRPPGSSKAIPAEDLAKLIEAARNNTSEKLRRRDYAIILFLADTGCRAGGLASLSLDSLNFEKREALLHEKGDNYVVVPFSTEVATALRNWLQVRPHTAHRYVFTGIRGDTPFTSESVGELIKRLCQRAGIRRYGPHAIRHRVGQAWADAGMPATLVRDKLGHKNVQVTLEHYFNQDTERLKQATDQLALTAARTKKLPPSSEPPQEQPKVVRFEEFKKVVKGG